MNFDKIYETNKYWLNHPIVFQNKDSNNRGHGVQPCTNLALSHHSDNFGETTIYKQIFLSSTHSILYELAEIQSNTECTKQTNIEITRSSSKSRIQITGVMELNLVLDSCN